MKKLLLKKEMIEGPEIGLALSQKQCDQLFKHFGALPHPWVPDGSTGATHRFIGRNGKLVFVITLDPSRHNLRGAYENLVHEAVHVFQRWSVDIGETEPSKEFEAYSIANIARRLMDKYDELRKNDRTTRR